MTTSQDAPAPATTSVPHDARAWVVGVDGSECSRHAALWASAHSRGRASRLRLTTAWSIPAAPALPPVGPMQKYWDIESYEQAAQATVESLADSLQPGLDIPIDMIVAEGQSSSVLLRAARDGGLLVIGSRGRGGFARLVLGSTSTQCATHAAVPTVVVPSNASLDPIDRVVVAIDGSQNSLAALRWALEFAAPGSTVECVGVWDVTPIAVGADQFFFPEASDLARDRFELQIATVVAEFDRAPGEEVIVTQRFIDGRPRQDLLAAAKDADLLVMGARGHGAVASVLLGSVSTWLLHHVKHPMVIVPNPDDGDDDDDDERRGTEIDHD